MKEIDEIEEIMNENEKEDRKKELIASWHKGYEWLASKEHGPVLGLTNDGNPYDHQLFMAGVKRMEQIENELHELGATEFDYNRTRAVEQFAEPV
jgi:hypothetical protein